MRLHELEITAFGPFTDTVRVDVDELAAGGLFLLTGDTGAGKTSVLDAVCFALYGEVPGDRHTAKHLRSDHADPDVAPLVVLRVSIGERSFRFSRSPAWERPKRRGTGTTRVQAHVVVEELAAGGWVTLTNRLDEAGHLVTSLLGMTCTQFTQVAMLPQGRFQAFLRASSAERQAVLQRLFRTRRFEDVERWLAERRLVLGRASREHHDGATRVLSRVLEAAGADLPDDWTLDDLEHVADDGRLARWTSGLHEAAHAALARHAHAHGRASEALVGLRAELDAARAHAATRARGTAALATLEELAAHDDEAAATRALLERHRRARPVLPLVQQAQESVSAAARAREAASEHAVAAATLLRTFPETLEASAVEISLRALRAERAVAESWLPREQELAALRRREQEAAAGVEALVGELADLRAEAGRLAEVRGAAAHALEAQRVLAERRPGDEAAAQAARAGHAAAIELLEVRARVAEAEELVRHATEESQELREVYQELREARISGMAAELAVGLAVGASCPVCGSHEHPSPATSHAGVSRADEDAARDAWETAAFGRQAAEEMRSSLGARLTALLPRAEDRSEGDWSREVATREEALGESSAALAALPAAQQSLSALDAELAGTSSATAAAEATLAGRRREARDLGRQVAGLDTELRRLLAGHPGTPGVDALLRELDRVLDVLERARDALLARDQAARETSRSSRSAQRAAREAGFDDVDQLLDAVLDDAVADAHAADLGRLDAARASAEAVLEDAEVARALDLEPVDPGPLVAAVAEAEQARDGAHAAYRQAEQRAARLDALLRELDDLLVAWEPVRRDHQVTASLASLVEGRSADNQWRMRLSAYVLSERLRQVVAAANERLGSMTDERYTLAQVDEKGAGEQRGGLSLRVRDEWSGKERDPATLSGGETFLVSLALALGLADTVSHEAGGTQLDTLFVDEGFGALDATTLDGVMDVLDGLRDGGRVVGLVSHVAELRDRVTTRLEVRKARRGSTLSPVLVGPAH